MQVVSSTGEEVFFKIKTNTKLSKLQVAYANKVGKDVGTIRCVLVDFCRCVSELDLMASVFTKHSCFLHLGRFVDNIQIFVRRTTNQ